MGNMEGKICIVTGSNSGIGKETALGLAEMGAKVVMVVRNRESGEKARSEIVDRTGNKSIDLLICDLSLMDSIRHFSAEFKSRCDRLDVLVNNAGAVFSRRQVTTEGFERTLAVNYLAPFLLTHEMLDLLKSSTPSRIVNLSSGLHKSGRIDFSNLMSEKNYSGGYASNAYSNAKLMVIMFTYELARRLQGTGVTVNVAMPGFVATNLGRYSGSLTSYIGYKLVRPMQMNAKKGAETPLYLASSEDVKYVTGKCFAKKVEATTAQLSYDRQLQGQLWAKTEELLLLAGTHKDLR
jgi:NAD(P)-dependent dehydrogenase (short-subunit alcohol dehydrogenase family)